MCVRREDQTVIVDLHSHYLPVAAGAVDGVGVRIERQDGGSYSFADAGGHQTRLVPELTSTERQLEAMDRQGIDQKVLAVPPFCFQYELAPDQGLRWSRAINEGIAEAVASASDRFIGFATVPLQNVSAAVEEIDHAVKLRLQGVEIATNINGVELDAASLDPFWDRCQHAGMPILIHPHYVAGVDRMRDYHLRNLVGNPLETALAGARLIFGGVLERFPDLKIILSHGGGALPAIAGRLEHGRRVRSECAVSDSIASGLRRLYYDSIVFNAQSLCWLVDLVGADRVVLGTDYPFDMSEEDPVAFVRSSGLDEEAVRHILSVGASFVKKAAT
jgi:aminocarboxymuconate-semialdehyde decarboxylase